MNLEIFTKIKILSHGAGRSERLASPGDIKHKFSASKKGVSCSGVQRHLCLYFGAGVEQIDADYIREYT